MNTHLKKIYALKDELKQACLTGDLPFLQSHQKELQFPTLYVCGDPFSENHFTCIKYLHEQHCPWNMYSFLQVLQTTGHEKCLRYFLKEQCPCDLLTLLRYTREGFYSKFLTIPQNESYSAIICKRLEELSWL